MNTFLTDFTSEELVFALMAITEKKDAAIHNLAGHEVLGTSPDAAPVKYWKAQVEASITWMVQLETALNIVKQRETVASN